MAKQRAFWTSGVIALAYTAMGCLYANSDDASVLGTIVFFPIAMANIAAFSSGRSTYWIIVVISSIIIWYLTYLVLRTAKRA